MLLEDKHDSELTFADLEGFLDRQIGEGLQLDYKQQVTQDIAQTACAFANTSGGHIIVGVDEVRAPDQPDKPNAESVPGVEGKHKASARDFIIGRTRPPGRGRDHCHPY